MSVILLKVLWYAIPIGLLVGVWGLGVALYGFDWGLATAGGILLGFLLVAAMSVR